MLEREGIGYGIWSTFSSNDNSLKVRSFTIPIFDVFNNSICQRPVPTLILED